MVNRKHMGKYENYWDELDKESRTKAQKEIKKTAKLANKGKFDDV